ncbi:TetR/AcrR family transcriptional regulator [Rhodococcus sp. HM1]|uniref:TetR/AcrR family transcriptional regulator n=1 Tax=Rhodococcus sp. HM1 TaxID=2937759 RepID=UPI00200A9343|nr:TetR/AcrR family transcriptional regulator [Rhodococcus sp. HM1]MCK8671396.1 TetR/AcrR family transcriptional regulator [Rhodococcus sp. HM1]
MARRQDGGPRAAMTASAVALMRERGVAATSFADVLAHSGAPRGSIYHHFPGGKSQLIEEATRSAAHQLTDRIQRILDSGDTVTAIRSIVDLWRRVLEATDYVAGCPIVAAALGTEASARDIAGVSFTRWTEMIGARLVGDGVDPARAATLATMLVSALEGGLILAQAQRSAAPLDAVVGELELLCRAAGAVTPTE